MKKGAVIALCVLGFSQFLIAQNLEIGKGFTKDDLHEFNLGGTSMLPGPVAGSSSNKAMACGTSSVMNTPYNSNNGQRGAMFDVLAANSVTISCFDVNLYAGTTANYEIYYRPSTHVGFENNSAGWVMLGSATGVTSAGNNLPTAIPITFNVTIPAGQRYSFYITNDFGGGTSYTDGTAVGNFLASDANITVYEGVGKSYPFGLTFTVRNINAHIFYGPGVVLNDANVNLQARATPQGVLLGWAWEALPEEQRAILERAPVNGDFEAITAVAIDENENHFIDRTFEKGIDYVYRLAITAPDGETRYSNTTEVLAANLAAMNDLFVYPSPAKESVNIEFNAPSEGKYAVQVTDMVGKVIHTESYTATQVGQPFLRMIDCGKYPAGMYLVNITGPQFHNTGKWMKQ